MEIKIKTKEIRKLMEIDTPEFPKYTTQILNLANQNSRATRPDTVGQMSELIKKFDGKTVQEWEEWYLTNYPDSIEKATEKISEMIDNLKEAIGKIDKELITKWVKDLLIVKTFIGLKFQEAILKKIANEFNLSYRLSNPEEESKGIDGYIEDIKISIKPETYSTKNTLREKLEGYVILYKKEKDGITIRIPDELETTLLKRKSK